LGKSANLKISTSGGSTATVENAVLPEGFCAFYWAVGLHAPRGLRVATNNDILVVEQGLSQITVLWQDNIFEQSSLPNLRQLLVVLKSKSRNRNTRWIPLHV
jgi:hypothetical protein